MALSLNELVAPITRIWPSVQSTHHWLLLYWNCISCCHGERERDWGLPWIFVQLFFLFKREEKRASNFSFILEVEGKRLHTWFVNWKRRKKQVVLCALSRCDGPLKRKEKQNREKERENNKRDTFLILLLEKALTALMLCPFTLDIINSWWSQFFFLFLNVFLSLDLYHHYSSGGRPPFILFFFKKKKKKESKFILLYIPNTIQNYLGLKRKFH